MRESALGSVFIFRQWCIGLDYYKGQITTRMQPDHVWELQLGDQIRLLILGFWIHSQIGILVHNKYVRKLEIWR